MNMMRMTAGRRLGFLAAILGLWAGPLQAVDRTFVVNNGAMHTAENWDPVGVPGAGDTGFIGGDETPIDAVFSSNLAGPPDAIVVRTNGMISLTGLNMTEHNLVLEGGTLRATQNRAFGTTISLRNESRFMTSGSTVTFSGLVQDAGAEAGMLIVTNSTNPTNLSGTVAMTKADNTYSGGTMVYPGTLSVSVRNALGTGPVTLLPGSTLYWNGAVSLASPLHVLGGILSVSANQILSCTNRVSGDLRVEVTGPTTAATLAGLIEDFSVSQTGRLVKAGVGRLSLNTPNSTYSGGTVIETGTLSVYGPEKTMGYGPVTVEDGAEIWLYGVTDPTWPGWEVEVRSNATVRLQSTSAGDCLTNNLVVRNGGIIRGHSSIGNYASYDQVRIEGRVFLYRYPSSSNYNLWRGVFSDGAEPGRLVLAGDGVGRTEFYGVNTYTGGTEIEDGGTNAAAFKLVTTGRMPDVGEILIHQNGVMDFNSISDTVGGLAGVGAVLLGSGTVTVNEGMSPGTNDLATGLLTVTGTTGRIVLAGTSTNLFHLLTPAEHDRVRFEGAAGLTLGGVIRIAAEPAPASGAYTLFELTDGTLLGDLPELILPPDHTGSLDTSSGDVVLTLKAPSKGTIIMVR